MVVSLMAAACVLVTVGGWTMDLSCDDDNAIETGAGLKARAKADNFCRHILWGLLVATLALQFAVGACGMTAAAMASVYLTGARPGTKATVLAAQRMCQQLGANPPSPRSACCAREACSPQVAPGCGR